MLTHLGACTARVLAVSAPRALARGTPTASRALPARLLSTTPHRPASSSSPQPPRGAPRLLDQSGNAKALTLQLPDGATTSFSYVWLRDHCREERSYHPATRQRLVDTPKIPADYRPQAVRSDERGVSLTWPDSPFESSYESFFPWAFLAEHAYNPPVVREQDLPSVNSRKVLWTREIARDMPTVSYDEVMSSEQGVYEWLKRIDTYGFSLCSGIPGTPEATEALIRRIAFIRETHYGGFWDFTANLEHGDLAYSEVRLEAHTDTTYFTDPCGLQLFHLLSPSTTHTGGHNLLVDGFRAASVLREAHPAAYDLLSSVPIPSHASGSGSASLPSGVHLRPLRRFPVLNHDDKGELVMVRWNGDDRAVVGGEAFEGARMDEWYEALRTWEGILRSEEAQLWSQMEVGTAVIFDNLRVLHGRSAFTGERRLCGAYVNGDDYRSRLRGLEKQFVGGDPRRRALEGVLKERYGIERKGEGKGSVSEEYL
ncbi:mitochondrial protein [Rhodotorula diobovata]|uniref:trimethyllysine dioxygenase n=1 Tax=Rhodotorula diobovata TaxID=5288 RepID=A0A5C5FK49_9BASI|nr:mitochondrial protein [Rhodotorula diobovata]